MKKENKKDLYLSLTAFALFIFWTLLVCFADVRAIGPMGSRVGLATVNAFVHDLFGVHLVLYDISDWLGLVPILFAALFGALGLSQWIKRRTLGKVDRSILILGGFYAVTVAAYLFFEYFAVNFRPVLIDGRLEASYPSSTTLLTLCVMPTAVMQLGERIKNLLIKRCASFAITVFALFMTLARLVSGVHWFTDIIGGVLLSASLVFAYRFFSRSSGDNL